MKKITEKIAVILIMAIISNNFFGCASTSISRKYTTPVQYSFAEDSDKTASITFILRPGSLSDEIVYFVDFEGVELPAAAEGTHWDRTIIVPAEVPLKINTYVVRDRHMIVTGGPDSKGFGDLASGMASGGGVGIILFPIVMAGILIAYLVIGPIDVIASVAEDRYKYVVFECPPLQAGGHYELTYNYRAILNDELILTRIYTEQQGLLIKRNVERQERIHIQRFQATLGERDKERSFSHFRPSVME
jgi:hypothetical protein